MWLFRSKSVRLATPMSSPHSLPGNPKRYSTSIVPAE